MKRGMPWEWHIRCGQGKRVEIPLCHFCDRIFVLDDLTVHSDYYRRGIVVAVSDHIHTLVSLGIL